MRCFVAALLCGPTLAAATITTLDGQTREQDLRPAVLATLPLTDLDRIVLGAEQPVKAGPGVWLADGSWLPYTRLAADGKDRLRIDGPLGTCSVPLAQVRGWGPTDPPAGEHDRLVLGGGPVEGQVTGLSAEGVLSFRTTLDPEPVPVPITDISAAVIRVAAVTPAMPALLATLADDRPPVRLKVLPSGLALAIGGSIVTPPPTTLIVDGPRRQWLSALTPSSVREDGAFGVVWPWKRDTDLDGGPLRLGGHRYASGVSVHSAAVLTWTLGGTVTRLRALIGIADLVAPEGDADVTLTGDGRELWREKRLRGGEPPRTLDLDLTGVTSLTLTVGLGERYDIGDHVTLADAYLVRR